MPMTKIRDVVPMIEVESIERSIAFSESLGFEVLNTFTPDGEPRLGWVSLRAGADAVRLMLSRGEFAVRDPDGYLVMVTHT